MDNLTSKQVNKLINSTNGTCHLIDCTTPDQSVQLRSAFLCLYVCMRESCETTSTKSIDWNKQKCYPLSFCYLSSRLSEWMFLFHSLWESEATRQFMLAGKCTSSLLSRYFGSILLQISLYLRIWNGLFSVVLSCWVTQSEMNRDRVRWQDRNSSFGAKTVHKIWWRDGKLYAPNEWTSISVAK